MEEEMNLQYSVKKDDKRQQLEKTKTAIDSHKEKYQTEEAKCEASHKKEIETITEKFKDEIKKQDEDSTQLKGELNLMRKETKQLKKEIEDKQKIYSQRGDNTQQAYKTMQELVKDIGN